MSIYGVRKKSHEHRMCTANSSTEAQAVDAAEHHTVRVDRKTQLDVRPSAFHVPYFRQNRTSDVL